MKIGRNQKDAYVVRSAGRAFASGWGFVVVNKVSGLEVGKGRPFTFTTTAGAHTTTPPADSPRPLSWDRRVHSESESQLKWVTVMR